MIEAFKNGEDIHASTAAKVFNVPLSDVTREQRSNAKTVNFGIIYGVSAFGLSNQTDLTRKESKELIDMYYETYPKLRSYIAKQVNFARENGYVETVLQRRRYLKDINSRNAIVRGAAERNAVNAPIQGSAADIIKLAMINIYKRFEKEGFKSKMLLQVHDELVFDVPKEEDFLLEPDDYKYFTLARPKGALTLDFGTVGKDLFTCSVTDDIELVHKNMISQQFELNPWVQFDWFPCSEKEWDDQMVLYNGWIEENNVADYLDLSQPKFNPGRHQLGHCISHDFSHPEEFVDKIISQTPKINSFFITDDDNQSIL